METTCDAGQGDDPARRARGYGNPELQTWWPLTAPEREALRGLPAARQGDANALLALAIAASGDRRTQPATPPSARASSASSPSCDRRSRGRRRLAPRLRAEQGDAPAVLLRRRRAGGLRAASGPADDAVRRRSLQLHQLRDALRRAGAVRSRCRCAPSWSRPTSSSSWIPRRQAARGRDHVGDGVRPDSRRPFLRRGRGPLVEQPRASAADARRLPAPHDRRALSTDGERDAGAGGRSRGSGSITPRRAGRRRRSRERGSDAEPARRLQQRGATRSTTRRPGTRWSR